MGDAVADVVAARSINSTRCRKDIGAREVMGVVREVARNGRTLVLAIHQLIDAERVCDRFVLLADGRIRGIGTLADLRAQTGMPAGGLEDVFLALT